MALEEERNYFERHKPELLERHRDLFVLVKGSDLAGVYADAQTAYTEGLARFGLQPFLVKQVVAEEPVAIAPMLSMTPPDARL